MFHSRPSLIAYVPVLLISLLLHGLAWRWLFERPVRDEALPQRTMEASLVAPPAKGNDNAVSPPSAKPGAERTPTARAVPRTPPPQVKRPEVSKKRRVVRRTRPQMPAPSPEAALRRVEEKPAAEQAPSPVAEAAPGPEQSGSAKSTEAADAGAGQGGTPAAAVNHHASYLHNPRPRYPPLARRRGWEGVVRLRVRVLEDGSCDQANIATSSGHESLDEAALAAVKQWRFVPAKRGDDPVVSWVVIPIVFKLSN